MRQTVWKIVLGIALISILWNFSNFLNGFKLFGKIASRAELSWSDPYIEIFLSVIPFFLSDVIKILLAIALFGFVFHKTIWTQAIWKKILVVSSVFLPVYLFFRGYELYNLDIASVKGKEDLFISFLNNQQLYGVLVGGFIIHALFIMVMLYGLSLYIAAPQFEKQ